MEFLQISLLRSGLVDQRRLDAIRNQFDVLDINADQKVSRLEVAAMVRCLWLLSFVFCLLAFGFRLCSVVVVVIL